MWAGGGGGDGALWGGEGAGKRQWCGAVGEGVWREGRLGVGVGKGDNGWLWGGWGVDLGVMGGWLG